MASGIVWAVNSLIDLVRLYSSLPSFLAHYVHTLFGKSKTQTKMDQSHDMKTSGYGMKNHQMTTYHRQVININLRLKSHAHLNINKVSFDCRPLL